MILEASPVGYTREDDMKDLTQKSSLAHKLGDVCERIGEMVSSIGAKKLGSKIYNYGNRLEHKSDTVKDTRIGR
jgi:hypothetical protein